MRRTTQGIFGILASIAEEYEDGEFSGAPDTWISGLDKAVPGNIMLADPQLGTPEYLQGWSPDIEFLDCAKVYKMQAADLCPARLLRERHDH